VDAAAAQGGGWGHAAAVSDPRSRCDLREAPRQLDSRFGAGGLAVPVSRDHALAASAADAGRPARAAPRCFSGLGSAGSAAAAAARRRARPRT
jgi:hypothetical protein